MGGTRGTRSFAATATITVVAAVVLSACSSGDDGESTAVSGDEAAPEDADAEPGDAPGPPGSADTTAPTGTTTPMTPVTTAPAASGVAFVVDPDTGLPVEVDQAPAGPLTYDEVVDRGVAAGIWTEADGLARAIGHAAGVLPDELVPGADTVVDGGITNVLARANALGASGTLDTAEAENLRRFYEAAMPPEATRDRLAATAEPTGPGSGLRIGQPAAACVPVDPADFTSDAWIEGCYRADVFDVAGHTMRVLYPSWYDTDETLAGWPLLAGVALRESIETYAPLATVGDIDLLFSATDTVDSDGTLGIAVAESQWGEATISGACPVVVFPNAQSASDAFKQTIAHEVWHCVQHYSAGLQNFGTNAWFLEGSAEYFSNVVYDDADDEHTWLDGFDDASRTQSLYDFDYETWIWWQFLGNRSSPRAIADLTWEMVAAGDGGKALMAERAGDFQRFVVDYVAGTIADQSGEMLPRATYFNRPKVEIVKQDEGTTKQFETEPMVASRFVLEYQKQLRFLQSDQTTDANGEHAMVEWARRTDPAAWKQVHPEVRSTCDEPVLYVLVATSGEDPYEAKVRIDETEQAVCDPCLLGTWSMQLDTFESMLKSGIEAEGGLPAGIRFDLVGGEYLLAFDAEGGLTEQRDALTIRAGTDAGAVDVVIDSFAEGDYQADGEEISATDLVESSVSVRAGFPGFGSSGSAGSSSIFASSGDTTSGSGTYDCDRDVLIVTVQGFDPVVFDRVDRILEPPDTIPG